MVFLTALRLAKKPKSKNILVMVESTVTGHRINLIRERLGEKLEFMKKDPYIQQTVLYREKKKVRSI